MEKPNRKIQNLHLFINNSFLVIYVLLFTQMGCKMRISQPPNPPEVVSNCYIQLQDFVPDLCNEFWYNNRHLNLEMTILVQDPNNPSSSMVWTHTGVSNPRILLKSDLIASANTTTGLKDCILSQLPGRQKFLVKVRAVGDCCKFCPTCIDNAGLPYYGKKLWFGDSGFQTYSVPLNNKKYLVSIPIKIDLGNLCASNIDCK